MAGYISQGQTGNSVADYCDICLYIDLAHMAASEDERQIADDLVSLLTSGIPVEMAGAGATVDMFEEAQEAA